MMPQLMMREAVAACGKAGQSIDLGPVLLRAEGLKKAFGGHTVLDGADLEIRKGKVILLRGENGSGKTTLLNILTGNLEPDSGAIYYLADGTPRTYKFPKRWWQELNPFDHFTPEFVAREGIGRTWQDARLFGAQSLRENIALAEPRHPGENPVLALIAPSRSRQREEEIRRKADAILARFGLAGRENSSADKISLGQSKRVAIARAVAAGARILFLDEPLAGLDFDGIADVLALLKALVQNHVLTLVVVEHIFNQPHLSGLVTEEWLLEDGRLKCNGKAGTATIGKQLTSFLAEEDRPPWFDCLVPAGSEVIDISLPRGAKLTRIRRPGFSTTRPPILRVSDLLIQRGHRMVLGLDEQGLPEGFNLDLYAGELAILQAPNGWGKSTLFDALTGILPPSSGSIMLDDVDISKQPLWMRRRAGLSLVSATNNVIESLQMGELHRLARSRAMPGFASAHLYRKRKISTLSGGQKQLLALTMADSREKVRLQLFDEPFSMLDASAIQEAIKLMSPTVDRAVLIAVPTSINPR